jgi:hypothetical protein
MRVRSLLSISAALCVALFASACEGENLFVGVGFTDGLGARTGAIEGAVRSTTTPLGGVSVILVGRDSTQTDGSGIYRFDGLPASTYTLTLRVPLNHALAPGDSAIRRVRVAAGQVQRVNWNLVVQGVGD